MKNTNDHCAGFEDLPCTFCDERSVFVVKEQQTTFRLENTQNKRICQIQIDGCTTHNIPADKPKCDYAFILCEHNTALFVELKGTDLIHAARQLYNSIVAFEQQTNKMCVNAYIICIRVDPNEFRFLNNDPTVKKLRDKLRKQGGELKQLKSNSPVRA